MLNLPRLHAPIEGELKAAFDAVLSSGRFINGPSVTRFEDELAAHVGVAHAVGVSSGTDALLATMMALRVKPGDRVITTPYTFFATAGCIARLGATPVFVDIDPESFNIDAGKLEEAVTDDTVGIIPVHLFGRCADMTEVNAVAARHDLWVLEDAAQAIRATHAGASAGGMGIAGTFSFFPAKNLGAFGDGGAVVTGDDDLAERIRALRGHGAKVKYYHDLVGGNFRLDALQAALLSVKLPHLAAWGEGRRRVAKRYGEALGELPGITLPSTEKGDDHVFNQYVIRCDARDDLKTAFEGAGVGCAIYYPVPLHLQPCFADLGYGVGDFPQAERAARETLAIPVDPALEENDQLVIINLIKKTLR